jgi:hypothetical protein
MGFHETGTAIANNSADKHNNRSSMHTWMRSETGITSATAVMVPLEFIPFAFDVASGGETQATLRLRPCGPPGANGISNQTITATAVHLPQAARRFRATALSSDSSPILGWLHVQDSASPAIVRAQGKRADILARIVGAATSIFGWLMCTLAAGAVAAFAALVLDSRPCWLILALALPLAWVLQKCGCLYARAPGSAAAFAVLLAGFYAICLVAISHIAAATGFPFGEAFRTGGIGLTLQVAELGLDALSILVHATAAVAAAVFATRLARPRY